MKPLIYGYLRATYDNEIRQRELGLEELADAEGLCLATIYYECVPSCQNAFNELRRERRRLPSAGDEDSPHH